MCNAFPPSMHLILWLDANNFNEMVPTFPITNFFFSNLCYPDYCIWIIVLIRTLIHNKLLKFKLDGVLPSNSIEPWFIHQNGISNYFQHPSQILDFESTIYRLNFNPTPTLILLHVVLNIYFFREIDRDFWQLILIET